MNRLESDSIGTLEVDNDAYYGVQTKRAVVNFPMTGRHLNDDFINSLALIKKACAMVNRESGLMSEEKATAIIEACERIMEGEFHDQFVVDPIQGGAGTSMNMNANEVIANVALEILGKQKGEYAYCHPNDDVNFGQSTNDVIPTAGKITSIVLINRLMETEKRLLNCIMNKSKEFAKVIKMGRTQLQDAVPITLGQEFAAYGSAVKRAVDRLERCKTELYELNMGGTAVGTGINADINYYNHIVPCIASLTGMPFVQAANLIDSTSNIDCFINVSGAVKSGALALSKIANDLRLMSSGPKTGLGEINLPKKQNGSSIMPGKVNPVIPEVVSQVAFLVAGNDIAIAMAVEAGQLELNAFEPIIFDRLFESIKALNHAVETFNVNCIRGITADEDRCFKHLHDSVGIITALVPHIGYGKAAELAKEALEKNVSVKSLILEKGIMSEEKLNVILDAVAMTSPGIAGEKFLTEEE